MSNKNDSSDQLLNVQQAASFLGVNPGTIRRWAQGKTLQGLKVGIRGDWRFRQDELLEIAKSNTLDSDLNLLQVEHLTHLQDFSQLPIIEDTVLSDHFVQFYESDAALSDWVSEFVGTGLRKGEVCIVIGTYSHRGAILERLGQYGIDISATQARGQLVVLDAEETLSKFMIDDMPDSALFTQVIGSTFMKSSESRVRVRAFGEMVAILWQKGNKAGAIQLEKLWNDLGIKYSFILFCAYPLHGVGGVQNNDSFADVCETHLRVLPSESYISLSDQDARLQEIAVLQQKAKSLEDEVGKRKKLERQKDEFLAIASHELKTPVTSVKVMAQMLERRFSKRGDVESASLLKKMDQQMGKLTVLIGDLLDVSKVDVGKMQYNEVNFSINELLTETVEMMQMTTSSHKLNLKLESIETNFYGDRERIGQVMTNLLSNAIKYSPAGREIVVIFQKENENALISVVDSGIGIDKKDHKKIFRRFFRVGGVGRETYPGMGIGLYLSNEIIKRHGGRIWAMNNKNNSGSTFHFTLPLVNMKQ